MTLPPQEEELPMAKVEVKPPTSIRPFSSLSVNVRFAQSAYQQSDFSFFTLRGEGELPLDAAHVVVLQYGSRNFRVGLAKDALPHAHPQVIAYREGEKFFCPDPNISLTNSSLAEDLEERLAQRHRTARRKPPPPNLYAGLVAFNRSSPAQTISALNDAYGFEWTRTEDSPWVVGEAALRVDPKSGFAKRWPIRRGNFNRQAYSSYREVTNDLERIWMSSLRRDLGLNRRDFSEYGIVVVVPDVVQRWEVQALTALLVKEMGFKAVAFLPESLSGTFGTGISAACVVDVGATTSKVALVEDGQILSDQRHFLPFGGDTLTILFNQMLQCHAFPYAECDLNRDVDWAMMDELKIRLGTLDEDELGNGAAIYEAWVRVPGQSTLLYPFKVYEERILMPLSLFESGAPLLYNNEKEVLPLDGNQGVAESYQSYRNGDSFYTGADDSMELNYGSNHLPKQPTTISNESTGGGTAIVSSVADGLGDEAEATTEIDGEGELASTVDESVTGEHELQEETATAPNTHLSLLEAIISVLRRIENPDRLKKFLNSLLIIGNGHKFPYFTQYLAEQLRAHFPGYEVDFVLSSATNGTTGRESINVAMDAGMVSWKGGAVFAKLECIRDYFISSRDLERCGMARALRERLSFSLIM